MRAFYKLGVPAATFVAAVILGTLTTGSASAGEFCRRDVTGFMTGCGYSTMEQCQAASSGIGWMIWDAAKFLLSDVVIMGLIVLGLTGVLLDLAMRAIAKLLMPWS